MFDHLPEGILRQADDRPAAGAAAAATGGAAVVEAALGLVEEGLAQLAQVDTTSLPDDCLAGTVRRLGQVDGRVEGIQARFVAAAETALLPERSGANSTTAWVAEQTGRSRGQSARTGRLARASERAPELTDAVASGDLGPDHADTIANGLDDGGLEPEDLEELLPAARRQSPEMFRRQAKQVAGRRRQDRLRDRELVAREERSHRQWRLPDGSLRYEGQLPPAEGDLLETALGAFYQPDGKDVPDEARRSPAQRSADAMSALLRAALRAGEAGDVGGVRPHVSVVVPIEAMAALEDAATAGMTAVTEYGTVLSMAAFKKLACDATVRRVVLGPASEPTDIGRATRQWPAPMRAAIMAADGGCRGPGCDLPPNRCIVHHIRWWEAGGETSVANGAPLCDRHHDLVHDDGWSLVMDPATRICTWTSPEGSVVQTRPRGIDLPSRTLLTDDWSAPSPSDTSPAMGEAAPRQRDAATEGRTPQARSAAGRSATTERPRGRGDPARPRDPVDGGLDEARRARDDRAPPEPDDPEPLRLDL